MKWLLMITAFMAENVGALDDFDLYRYGVEDTIEVQRTKFIVDITFYDNERDIQWKYDTSTNFRKNNITGNGIRAFTISSKDTDVCYIHIQKADIWDDRELMAITGHELYHCMLAKHKGLEKKKDE